jgi:CarD family transcriptional regulator
VKRSKVARLSKSPTILRDLLVLKSEKELSLSERTMLDTARNLLVKELAIASQNPEGQILADLYAMFTPDSARLTATARF